MRCPRIIRAIPTLLRIGLADAIAYRGEFLIWTLATNMPLIMLLLWVAVAREAPIGRYGEKEFVAYFLATLIVRQLTGTWILWEMNMNIRQGTMVMRLLRPLHPFIAYAAENVAAFPVRVFFALPVALIALWIVGREQITHDALQALLVLPAFLGAWLMSFFFMGLLGCLAFWFESSVALFWLYYTFFFVFSGYTMPLEFFPPTARLIVNWLPFRFLLSFPVELMLGTLDRSQTWLGLIVQFAYVLFFLALALLLWRRGLRHYAAYGG